MFEKEAEESFEKVAYIGDTKLPNGINRVSYIKGFQDGYNKANEWHKIFVDSEPYNCEYWDLPQDTLPKNLNFYFVKLKNGFIKICELKYDLTDRKKCFYDLHGWKQSDVAEWLEFPKEVDK